MKKLSFTIGLLSLLVSTTVSAQQVLSVTSAIQPPYDNVENLIRNYFTGAGIELLKVESASSPLAVGYFTDGDSAINLHRGLILSSGFAESAEDMGQFQASSGNAGPDSLSQLQQIATGQIQDVAYFRITFQPFSDSIQFRYVFGSEEYPEYACTVFNDVFGFFLSGPNPNGGNYNDLNIALIPGTNLPVTINNIHPSNPSAIPPCTPLNDQFYHDNQNSQKQPVYDGFTDVFTAAAKVIPCGVYEMLIAIADVGDWAYDSAVFLEAKSLDSDVEITSSIEIGNDMIPEHAIADTITFTFNEVPVYLLPLQIKVAGTAINGLDYFQVNPVTIVNNAGDVVQFIIQPVTDSLQEQIETVEFIVCGSASNACFVKTFSLYIADSDSLYSPVDSLILPPNGALALSVVPTALSNKTWTFSKTANLPIPTNGALTKSDLEVSMPLGILSDIMALESVCMNINHNWVDDLDLFLLAPNGTFLDLSSDNGGNGDNYTNTCFAPSAIQEIRGGLPFAPASAAPFTGSFQPEGPWSDIVGTPINGIWSLGAVDDQNNITGTLLDWAITFSTNELGHFKFLWNTGETTTAIQVTTPGAYSVLVQNKVSSFTKTFVVQEGSVGTDSPVSTEMPFRLSPNPSSEEITLILDRILNINTIKIYDLQGKLMLEQGYAGPIIGSNNLPRGIYLVSLESSEGVFVQKLIRR